LFEAYSGPKEAYYSAQGCAGLYKTRQKVSLELREMILPSDLFEQYAKLSFWYNIASSRCNALTECP